MGFIDKFVRNSADRAIDSVQNFGDKMSGIFGRVEGYVGGAFEVAKNGETFVGMNYTEIPNIRAAIRTYVANIQTELEKLNSDASNSNAVKGEIAKAAQDYVKAVSEVSKAYTTALLAYSDKMYEYGEAYKKSDTTLSQNVADEASSLSSSVETYTEKY